MKEIHAFVAHMYRPYNNRLIKLDNAKIMWYLVGRYKWIRFGWLVIRIEDQRIR